ncbi:taurine transporter subunit, partial [Salmonella enterica subsp. enterica serovar Typhimurium]|nr:taurine transporter subunit [Salmonella enterica subsp. enterica serovar Typhimurium]
MSDIVQAPPIVAGREDRQVKLVKMASFGAGEKSTVAISVAT